MSFARRYGIPFLIMIVSGLIVRLFNLYLPVSIRSTLVSIAIAVSLFAFGLSLHIHKKRRDESWFKKLVISFFLMFFLLWDLGYIVFPQLKSIFNFLGSRGSLSIWSMCTAAGRFSTDRGDRRKFRPADCLKNRSVLKQNGA